MPMASRPPDQEPHIAPDVCVHCGGPRTGETAVLPYLTKNAAWVHRDCFDSWFAERRAKAAQSYFQKKTTLKYLK
jgi:hypothetical protein